ncbi:MAG: rhomboid family intramembrane serine protease [Eubacterium sp.]|nr:rhomboid family intramembrane serine protease [Eubacterium sp.]
MNTQKYRNFSVRYYYEVAGIRCVILDPQHRVLADQYFHSPQEAQWWAHDTIDRFILMHGNDIPPEASPKPRTGRRRKHSPGPHSGIPVITILLILINVIVFLIEEGTGGSTGENTVVAYGAQYTPYILSGHQWWRLFTSIFIHFGFSHIFSNMISLSYCGWSLERQYGRIRYLILYLASGIGGNILSLCIDAATGNYNLSAGASGAIFGLIGAYAGAAVMDRKKTNRRANPWLMIIFSVLMFIQNTGEGINIWAHLGGMLTGFVLGMLLRDNDHDGRPDFLQKNLR